jgi:hypothetical protein
MKIRKWGKMGMETEAWKGTVKQAGTHKVLQRQEKKKNR